MDGAIFDRIHSCSLSYALQDKTLATNRAALLGDSESEAPVNTGRLGAPVTPTSGDDDRCCRLIG